MDLAYCMLTIINGVGVDLWSHPKVPHLHNTSVSLSCTLLFLQLLGHLWQKIVFDRNKIFQSLFYALACLVLPLYMYICRDLPFCCWQDLTSTQTNVREASVNLTTEHQTIEIYTKIVIKRWRRERQTVKSHFQFCSNRFTWDISHLAWHLA